VCLVDCLPVSMKQWFMLTDGLAIPVQCSNQLSYRGQLSSSNHNLMYNIS
jgi:hypothetical protein